ncbi:peptidase S8/S53 domain-containing protein [Kockovaella imperatae]|uniref:Peptidase S8/S53 domain-containing protein n=1 Tax=Kockovaella imperatae TaxID=4999 RepID=A0A1Y1ULD3_9TREE|nr:peptidase S8/S53 domain-containing protein [Kockovaella imperatae]ORX38809.1 peptidase S8/S53 domain-containing protein [Kockovaella imperatae]
MRLNAATLSLLSSIGIVLATPIATESDAHLAPLSHAGDHIDDSYIVVFKKGIDKSQIALHLTAIEGFHLADPIFTFASDGSLVDEGGIKHVYGTDEAAFDYFGYAGTFSNNTLYSIRSAPEVAYVERDQVMHTLEMPHGVDEPFAKGSPSSPDGIVTALSAPWGLARISHRARLHLSTFTKYAYDPAGGEGVTAYVIDTGINVDHVEFEGRARWGKTIPQNDVDKDGNGHGTHCAGTIASRKYGVAKAAEVVAVKVLGSNGSGSMSDVVAGVVWAAEQAAKAQKAADAEVAATGKTKHKGSVANMSLGGGKAKSLDDAVDAAVAAGLHFAVAAGNDNKDACNYSPAAAVNAVTVGASTLGDERAYFSNHGKCVDIFAPGLNILSTWTGGNTTSNTISGTSMASPHICGLLAYLLSIHPSVTFSLADVDSQDSSSIYTSAYSLLPKLFQAVLPAPTLNVAPIPKNGTLTPKQLKKALIALASPGMLTDLPAGTPNLLAFNNATYSEK